MMTSAAESKPAVITTSAAVTAVLIASLFLTSVVRTSCAADAAASRHRNASSDDALSQTLVHLPSPTAAYSSSSSSFASSSSLEAQEKLFWVQWQQHQLRKTRKAGDASKPKDANKISCYHCTYVSDHDMSTDDDCNDPFQTGTRVMCDGSCYKSKKKLASEGNILIRGCAKTCIDKVDQNGYNKCCKTELCNHSTPVGSTRTVFSIVCATFLSLVLVRRL